MMFWISVFVVIALLLVAATKCFSCELIKKLRLKAKDEMMWNFVLTFINEAYIILALSCFMQFKHLQFKEPGLAFNSMLALIFGAIIVFTPFNNLRLLLKNKDQLDNEKFDKKYGSLYRTLNYKNNPTLGVLIEPCLSQLRIFVMAIALIYLENHPYF